ncbi:hypothetical protein J4E08_07595 [Sagittula sp. NFXS13]|uniref:hypothetical protein n=1 Tax=Sagittula sp. NFXS13 TaxID=2819095 RepID=UPI0032E02A03
MRDSRWQISSASIIPEKLAATLLFPMIENTSIRERRTLHFSSRSRRELAHRLRR